MVDDASDDHGSWERVTEHGPIERVDGSRHPRMVVIGLLLVLALLAAVVVGLASFLGTGRSASVEQVVIPRSAGRTAEQAQAQLDRLGLIVEVTYESNELIPAGVVVTGKPISGSRVDVGELVTLQVSDGPAGVKVPDVGGLNKGEAVQVLSTVGLGASVEDAYD